MIIMLNTFFESFVPFDIIMAKFFRNNKWIGSHDRREIAERSYAIFRNYEAIKFSIPDMPTGRLLVLAYLKKVEKRGIEEICQIFSGEQFELSQLTSSEREFILSLSDCNELPENAKLNYPAWMDTYFKRAFSKNIEQEMSALNEKAFVDLRVNTLKSSREEVIKLLNDFSVEKTSLSKNGVRILSGRISKNHKIIKNGLAEIQDEGSQLVAELCHASPKDTVVDFCAGAGGKTLAISASMSNKGRIFALDKYIERLKNAKLRFRRAGVNNVICQEVSGKWLKRHKEYADIVLVDAPCSGTGTWRRNPDMRAKFHRKDLDELTALQAEILRTAALLVKKGGRLVYSTCSVLLEENDDQIEYFLKRFPNFKVGKANISFTDEPYLRLSPFRNGTDGFFAACLERFE